MRSILQFTTDSWLEQSSKENFPCRKTNLEENIIHLDLTDQKYSTPYSHKLTSSSQKQILLVSPFLERHIWNDSGEQYSSTWKSTGRGTLDITASPCRKKKGRQPRDGNHRRKRTLIRTHFRVRGTTILAWRRRSGLLRVEKEKEAAEQSREKGRGRENGREWRRAFPLWGSPLFTGASTKWKMLDSARSER